jgi:acetyl esterase/lipase
MPSKPSRILACVFFALVLHGVARAQSTVVDAGPEILTKTRCFGGLNESYDDWMAFLRQKTGPLESLAFRYRFTRATYEHYQRTLECFAITYRSDGNVVRGWLVYPKRHDGSRLPVIIYNRDGNRAVGAVTFAQVFSQLFPLAERGYLLAVSQYRGAIPIPDEEVSPDQFGGSDVRDVTNLMRLVTKLPQADSGNVFMIGNGRGAIMSFRALQDSPVPVRAVAIYGGIYDLHELLRSRPEFDDLFRELIPNYGQNPKAELDKRSVNHWAARLPAQTGVLIVHNEEDDSGLTDSARAFAKQMKRLGRPYKEARYQGEAYFDDPLGEVRAETLAWFQKFRHGHAQSKPKAQKTKRPNRMVAVPINKGGTEGAAHY